MFGSKTTRRFILVILFITLLAVVATVEQRAQVSSAIDLNENSLLLTDMGSSRLVRVKDFSATGWEEGATAVGLSLKWPHHLTLDSSARIYLADRDNARIVRLDDLAGNGWRAFSSAGSNRLVTRPVISELGSGNWISSVALDAAGRIYITGNSMTGTQNGGIVRVDNMDGAGYVAYTPNNPAGGIASKSVVLDQQGRIYMSDNLNHRIVRFNDMQGTGLVTLGSHGIGINQFNEPEGLTIDSQGRIYIVDETNHRIVRINDMTGAGWTSFGSFGHGKGQLSIPHDVQVDSLGRIYIADTGNGRIVRIDDMTGSGWVDFGRRGCPFCSPPILGPFMVVSPKGIRVLGTGPTLTYEAIFPQVAAGGGYRTSIVGLNSTKAGVNAEILFQKMTPAGPNNPPPRVTAFPVDIDGVSASTFSRTVPSMGIMRLDATSAGGVDAGYATFRSLGELNGVALFQTLNGDTITSEAGVGLSSPMDRFMIYIDNTNNAQTGYAVANPIPEWQRSASTISAFFTTGLTLTLRDRLGVTLASAFINLSPGGHLSEFASQRFPATATPGFQGSIEFSTIPGKVNAVALRYDNTSQDVFTTIPVIQYVGDPNQDQTITDFHISIPRIESSTLYYPQVADGGTYRTNFVLVNPYDSGTTATLEFFGDDGSPLSLPIEGEARTSHTVSLAAKGIARIVTDGTSSGIKTGWARVTQSAGPSWFAIGGSAIFQTVAGGRITSEAGVSSSPAASHFTTYVTSRGFAESGLAIANPNNAGVTVTFNLRNPSGEIAASTTRNLPTRGHLAQFFTQLFPQGFDEFEGTLEVSSGGGPITGVALRYDNPGGTVFATTPVVVLP